MRVYSGGSIAAMAAVAGLGAIAAQASVPVGPRSRWHPSDKAKLEWNQRIAYARECVRRRKAAEGADLERLRLAQRKRELRAERHAREVAAGGWGRNRGLGLG